MGHPRPCLGFGARAERQAEQFQPMFAKNLGDEPRVGCRCGGSRRCRAQFAEEEIQAPGNHRDQRSRRALAGIHKGMAAAARGKDGCTWARVNFLAVNLKEIFAFKDVPPLILRVMQMKRRPALRGGGVLEDGEGSVGVAAGDLDADLVAYDGQRCAVAVLDRKSVV